MTNPTATRIAAAAGFLAVALGAFGAHGLENLLAQNGRAAVWHTAVLYHLIHAVMLFVLAERKPLATGPWWCFLAGIVIFSGSLYLLAVTNARWLGAVTPLGGISFLAGWFAAKHFLKPEEFESLVKQSDKDGKLAVSAIIGAATKKEIIQTVKTLKAVRDGKPVDDAKLDQLFAKVGIVPREVAKNMLKDEALSSFQRGGNSSIRKIHVKATTIQSSKGLAADYVFITHFDDQYFIKNKDKTKITDQDICNFLVALTRAKRKVFLVSSDGKKEPTFLKWIDKGRIEEFVFKSKGK